MESPVEQVASPTPSPGSYDKSNWFSGKNTQNGNDGKPAKVTVKAILPIWLQLSFLNSTTNSNSGPTFSKRQCAH